jgi:hypothetical protein
MFLDLSEGKRQNAQLHDIERARFTPAVKAIALRLLPGESEPSKTLELVSNDVDGAVFQWSRSAEGWLECAELLDGLSGPGHHQYLTHGGIDDALVKVSLV